MGVPYPAFVKNMLDAMKEQANTADGNAVDGEKEK